MKYIFFIFFAIPFCSNSQNLHLSAKFGLGGYNGELKPKTGFGQTKIGWSIGARYDLGEHLIARSYLNFGKLQATDAKQKTTATQQRNLDFTAKLREFELGIQYSIFSLNEKWWTPYVFVGGSIFTAKPYTILNGQKVFLQPLSTEGQGFTPGKKTYKTTSFAIPIGFGAEYALGEDVRVGIEFSYHKTFTDYIDDVSTSYVDAASLLSNKGALAVAAAYRGSGAYPPAGTIRGTPKTKDGFYFAQLVLTVRPFVNQFNRTYGIASMKKPKRVGCPQTKGIF
jgi:opacity protein-like surface antigen